MSRWLLRSRVGIAALLTGAFLALSLCPSECLAAADGRPAVVADDCHDAYPAEENPTAGHDLDCCAPALALAARPGADAAALEPPPVLFAPRSVTLLAVHALDVRAPHLATARHGPEPFRARAPILQI
jgi:hypothetical protein